MVASSSSSSSAAETKKIIPPARPLHVRKCRKQILLGIQRHKLQTLNAKHQKLSLQLQKAQERVKKCSDQLDRFNEKSTVDSVHTDRLFDFVRFLQTQEDGAIPEREQFETFADEWESVSGIRAFNTLTPKIVATTKKRVSEYLLPILNGASVEETDD